jgi:excisionase family DNA binding protein
MESLSSFLNVKEVATYLALKTSTIYSMVEERKIPCYRIGRKIRFKKSLIDRWMEEQRQEVVEIKVEERKIRSIKKTRSFDDARIVKKGIDEPKGRRYTSGNGKPDPIEGLREEVEDGTL